MAAHYWRDSGPGSIPGVQFFLCVWGGLARGCIGEASWQTPGNM